MTAPAYAYMTKGALPRKLTWDGGQIRWGKDSWPLKGAHASVVSAGFRHVLVITWPGGTEISGQAQGPVRRNLGTIQQVASAINTAAARASR